MKEAPENSRSSSQRQSMASHAAVVLQLQNHLRHTYATPKRCTGSTYVCARVPLTYLADVAHQRVRPDCCCSAAAHPVRGTSSRCGGGNSAACEAMLAAAVFPSLLPYTPLMISHENFTRNACQLCLKSMHGNVLFQL